MTREEAKGTFEDLRGCKIILSDLSTNEQEELWDMAISALSENKGEWIKIKNGYKCSACGHIMDKVLSVSGNLIYQYSNFCPDCGADMRGE